LEDNEFFFLGFLPREQKAKQEVFDRIRKLGSPTCFYESPRRVRETFQELKQAFPRGSFFYGREMTKVFEQFAWLDFQSAQPEDLSEQGEYVCLVLPGEGQVETEWEEEVRLRLASDRDWSKALASRFGVASRDVYNALQRLRGKTEEDGRGVPSSD
jgi:16S rRNA (cytidine1402-2'-O)-methyltransferase